MAVIKMSQMSLGIHQQHSLDFGVERAEKDCKITPHMIEYTKENFIKAAAVLLSKEYEQRMS
ncbi:MAG: hypothetical protein ACLUT1_02580 [Ruminococcus sp.]